MLRNGVLSDTAAEHADAADAVLQLPTTALPAVAAEVAKVVVNGS